MRRSKLYLGDCSEIITRKKIKADLVFGSPPYEDARKSCLNLKGEAWVQWALERYLACLSSCSGLVAWVVQGRTRNFEYSCVPQMLMVRLKETGAILRNPPIFHRVGICGSGGPDWLRSDYEHVICATRKKGRLPWSDNTACGHPPKWAPGGEMSHRVSSGARVNQWGHSINSGGTKILKDGRVRSKGKRPSHRLGRGQNLKGSCADKVSSMRRGDIQGKLHTKRDPDEVMREQAYTPPALANPGNVIKVLVGGGLMGSKLAHEHPAPFPEKLAEFFIRSFCPKGGTVLDPFCGSGTTGAVALRLGRKFIGIDIDSKWIRLTERRLKEAL